VEENIEKRIHEIGDSFFEAISGDAPSIFNKDWWTGKVLDWSMKNDHFKTKLFHFVDVLPTISSDMSLMRHVEDYFGEDDDDVPTILRLVARYAGLGGKLTAMVLAHTLRNNIEAMARQFIIGKNIEESTQTIAGLRKNNFAITVDILGEAAVGENEALTYQENYLDLLDKLAAEEVNWSTLGSVESPLDWGVSPKINISVKPTSLYSQANPVDFENSVQSIVQRFTLLIKKAKEVSAFVYIDMEQHLFKDITIEVYKRLRSLPEFCDYPHIGIVLQAYLFS